MLPIDTSRRLASVDCIFDESLHIRGQPCLQAGLSQGTITLDLPQEMQQNQKDA